MRTNRKNRSEEDMPNEWIVTYSDLVTLLLTFFVLLFSMSQLDKQKFDEVAASLRARFSYIQQGGAYKFHLGDSVIDLNKGVDVYVPSSGQQGEDVINADGAQGEGVVQAPTVEEVTQKIRKSITDLGLSEHVTVVDEKTYVTIRFDSVVLFESGKADILESGKSVLQKMGSVLQGLDHPMNVTGHTDDVPIDTYLFPTNWELSTKRATNVVMFLIQSSGLEPQMLTAAGNGEFRPIVPNDTPQNREKNRRIDITIEK